MIYNATITTSDTVLYTSVEQTAITVMIFCNTATPNPTDESINAVKLELHLVKNGTTVSTQNTIVKNLNIPAGETVFFDSERIVLDNGDEIVARVDTGTSLVATVSALPV